MARVRQTTPQQRRRVAMSRRDAALERLTAITAGIGVVSIAIVGALGVYVAKALPGHHAPAAAGSSRSSGTTGNTGGASNSANSLNPPDSAPQGASLPAPVTSGAS